MDDQGIFVKLERHDEIQTVIKALRQKTNDAREKLEKIRELDREESQKLEEFNDTIEHINANLDQMESFMK
ncbi:MAG: hypothetical protein ACP5N2_07410 [Candidatus Nanoarchaeia archaeon]